LFVTATTPTCNVANFTNIGLRNDNYNNKTWSLHFQFVVPLNALRSFWIPDFNKRFLRPAISLMTMIQIIYIYKCIPEGVDMISPMADG
jgi:hypothetical protein